jgi:hypothetical protein
MDVLWFLKRRITFVRGFYEQASKPFLETMEKIHKEEPPFDNPPYSEDPEPPFLEEWQDAEEGVEFLGQSCVSFVATSVKLYLAESEREFRRMWGGIFPFPNVQIGEEGVVSGYEAWFRSLGIDFRASGAYVEIIRELVATRNLAQHPQSIGFMNLTQRPIDREKFPKPFFGHPIEKQIYEAEEGGRDFPWMLLITPDSFVRSLDEVVKLAEWLDAEWLSGPKAMPVPPAPESPGEPVGVVSRYLGRIKVAGVRLAVEISVGDTLRFIKNKRDFEQEARSIQLNHAAVQVGRAGTEIGLEMDQPIGAGAAVYRVKKA